MKLTTLFISLSLALQLGASTNRPDAHANAAASASPTSAAAESDAKSNVSTTAERDTKLYAWQPYTAHMHPYAIAFDLGIKDPIDPAVVTEAIQHLPPEHQAIVMAVILPLSANEEDIKRQCGDYVRSLCRMIGTTSAVKKELLKNYFLSHPELLRPLDERLQGTIAALKAALPDNFVRDLLPAIGGYCLGFRYGRSVTDVPHDPMIHTASWLGGVIEDLTNLQVPTRQDDHEKVVNIMLTHNPICYLPEGMGANLRHIARFDLNGGLLELIQPGALVGMNKLYMLVLKNNRIRDLPDDIYALPALQYIYLQGNPLSDDTKRKLEDWKHVAAHHYAFWDADKKAEPEK